jgi:hypothetical protein
MKTKKLEAVIDSLTDSLEIVAHNKIETEYVLALRTKYEEHYKHITGRYYRFREVKDTIPTEEWKQAMDSRFNGL